MSLVASEASPLNCRWIIWNDSLPVCTRRPEPRPVDEGVCAVCEFWSDGAEQLPSRRRRRATASHAKPAAPVMEDPLSRETCPQCGSHDVVLMHRDALVQSFTCSICHQRWLATRPWPQLHETRSHDPHA